MNNTLNNDIAATMQRLKICVVMPTYNNAGTLADVVSEVLKITPDLIVVNDGSTDDSSRILSEFENRVNVVSYPKNKGKGYALKRGFKRALEAGYEYVITIDSDGQHYPSDIPHFVEAIAKYPDTLIVGERDLSKVDINGKSSFANKFSNFWFCLQTGNHLRDTQTGYRAYPLKHLYGLGLLTSRYEAELELMVFASWNGVKLKSIPIKVYYPPQSERVSHFRPVKDFARISLLNTVLCVGALVYALPVRGWKLFSKRQIFNFEFKPFTRRKGEKKEAATTLGRAFRTFYGILFFVFWSIFVFTPFALIYFNIGKVTEKKRQKFHRMLQWVSKFLLKRFPSVEVRYENLFKEDFETPAIIICNHQSHLDLPVLMAINPKLIFLTNDWVWNNFFYGQIIHAAEFLPVSAGMEVIMPKLKDLRDRGYSIVVFPEGTRSADGSILRFHQGAFYLAKELNLDILPMTIHGLSDYLPKKDMMFREGVKISHSILKRVARKEFEDLSLLKQASKFRKILSEEFDRLTRQDVDAGYYKSLVRYKYAYRGWDTMVRSKRELRLIPRFEAEINAKRGYKKVRFINSGLGVIPLLYALVNRGTEVYAFESSIKDYEIAIATPSLPGNLHYSNAVWDSEMGTDQEYDHTIILPNN